MTSIMPTRSVNILVCDVMVQPIYSQTADGMTFWVGLRLRGPDSPTGDVIAGVDDISGSKAWLTLYECPRRIIGAVTDPDFEMLHDLRVPSIDSIEKGFRRKAREARAEWQRLWSSGDDDAARVQKRAAHGYGELHRLIKIARAHRANATLRRSGRDMVIT